jgi:hypothetical protein
MQTLGAHAISYQHGNPCYHTITEHVQIPKGHAATTNKGVGVCVFADSNKTNVGQTRHFGKHLCCIWMAPKYSEHDVDSYRTTSSNILFAVIADHDDAESLH